MGSERESGLPRLPISTTTNTVLRSKEIGPTARVVVHYSRTTDLVARNIAMRERGHVYRVTFCTCLLREKKNTCYGAFDT